MKAYYYRMSDYGTPKANIIDEETLERAENGLNYLDVEDYDFLCEADSKEAAEKYYFKNVFSQYVSDQIMERYHP